MSASNGVPVVSRTKTTSRLQRPEPDVGERIAIEVEVRPGGASASGALDTRAVAWFAAGAAATAVLVSACVLVALIVR